MRIVFINTFDVRGGAAIVAKRLAQFLKDQYAAECFFLVSDKKLIDQNIFVTRTKAGKYIELAFDKLLRKIGLQYFFFPFSTRTLLKKIRQLKPDIVSLHNTHGGYFQTSVLPKISKSAPIVWTLHDMWSFTGNAAHTFGDESWKELKNSSALTRIYPSIGLNTGSYLLKRKKRIYAQSDLTIVTPSQWLFNLAFKSPLFEGKTLLHIKNGIDLGVFKRQNKVEVRTELKIPNDARVVMFSTEFLKNPWKGKGDIGEVLKMMDTTLHDKVHLLLIGEGEFPGTWTNLIVHQTGYIQDEKTMARYFSASDLFLYPTKADNLPNVLIEAIASGTPAVTFNIGGCSEIIVSGYNGIILEPLDYAGMAQAVIKLIHDKERMEVMSINARTYAEQNFSIEKMGRAYKELFEEILVSNRR